MTGGRTVTLVLVDDRGAALGALPPFPVDGPWWPEVADVLAGARDRYGVDAAVLRLLGADRPAPPSGAVTYLAQTGRPPPVRLTPVDVDLSSHPLRPGYAEIGGPAASLRWAVRAMRRAGLGPVTGVVQRKTWNLSAIWRLDTRAGPVWLKEVPGFFAHEPTVLAWLAAHGHGAAVPVLLAARDGRMLLADVPGQDLFGAGVATRLAIAGQLHRIQLTAAGRVPDLLAAGVPDGRAAPLAVAARAVVDRYGAADPRLAALIAGLDERLAAVAACGLPDTLAHGDLHPGNVRGEPAGTGRVLIDWGDSFVGHPAFDILRLSGGLPPADAERLVATWAGGWRAAVPGCHPERAVALLRPVEALRGAVAYAGFVARIEPAEHPYHAQDVPACLAEAVRLSAEPG